MNILGRTAGCCSIAVCDNAAEGGTLVDANKKMTLKYYYRPIIIVFRIFKFLMH